MANVEITTSILPVQDGNQNSVSYFHNAFDGGLVNKYVGQTFPHGGRMQYTPYTRIPTRIELSCENTSQSPKTFTVYESATGAFAGEESVILQVTDTSQMATDESRGWDISGATANRYWKIDFTVGYSATYTAINWIKMYADDGESLESPTTGTIGSDVSGSATMTAENNSGNAPNLIDDNTSTIWFGANSTAEEWIEAEFSSAVLTNRISYRARDDGSYGQAPNRLRLEASATGSWGGEEVELLDTGVFNVINVQGPFWTQDGVLTYDFVNETAYKYFRFQVADKPYKSANEIAIHETTGAATTTTSTTTTTTTTSTSTTTNTQSSTTSTTTTTNTQSSTTTSSTTTNTQSSTTSSTSSTTTTNTQSSTTSSTTTTNTISGSTTSSTTTNTQSSTTSTSTTSSSTTTTTNTISGSTTTSTTITADPRHIIYIVI